MSAKNTSSASFYSYTSLETSKMSNLKKEESNLKKEEDSNDYYYDESNYDCNFDTSVRDVYHILTRIRNYQWGIDTIKFTNSITVQIPTW